MTTGAGEPASGRSIGVDVGGTKVAAAVVSAGGTIERRTTVATPAQDPDAIVATIAGAIEELTEDGELLPVGVACAGYLDVARTTVGFAPNIAFRDYPLRERVVAATGRPVLLENDADAAAYGEYLHGAGSGATQLVMVTLGTGVGGGVVLDGRLYRGAFGVGGEVGHIRVERAGRLCGCGNRGCLEAYASGSALLRQARTLVRSADPAATELARACEGEPQRLTGAAVSAAAERGDAAAQALIVEVGTWLGEGLASIAAVLDPGVFVVGGGLSVVGDLLLEPARAAYAEHLTGRGHRPMADIVPGRLGNDAGIVGVAALAREE